LAASPKLLFSGTYFSLKLATIVPVRSEKATRQTCTPYSET
jgi:hypothetical protein